MQRLGRHHPFPLTASLLIALILLAVLPSPALAQAGSLDATFSGDGKTTVDFTAKNDSAWTAAIQADGKIVVGGEAAGSRFRFALARFNTDGTLDTTFGGDGRVTTDFTPWYDAVWGLAIQADGKIVAGGDAGLGSGNSRFAVARYNSDGSLDTSFSGDGKATAHLTTKDDPGSGLALQEDGKIVLAGGASANGRNPRLAVARFDVDGSLDATFSGDGKVAVDLTAGSAADFANAVVVQEDGNIVAGGIAAVNARFALVRFMANGTLDTTFSGDGKVMTDFSPVSDVVLGLALQADGRIVAAGNAGGGGSDPRFALARYNTNGTLDTTFSGDGKVTTQFTRAWDSAHGAAMQLDGKIVAVGGAAGLGFRFALARYNTDGSLDPTFSGDGKVITNFTLREDFARGVAIQDDESIVVSGYSGWSRGGNAKFALARYLAA
jgi:uncharacterized delta-60 repeat protein